MQLVTSITKTCALLATNGKNLKRVRKKGRGSGVVARFTSFFFSLETPEGKLPIFESDGVVLSQSQAIAAYAAELGGKDEDEEE